MIAAALLLASGWSMNTAGEVLRMCESKVQYEDAICLGFILGVARRDELVRMTTPKESYLCDLPAGVTYDQMQQVVITTLRSDPAKWHYHGAAATARALQVAFCPDKPR